MLELQSRQYTITGCFGNAAALDRVAVAAELSVRVAPDELLLLSNNGDLSALGGNDPSRMVVDLSSAFAVWALLGDGRHEAFNRLSAVELPASGVLQGLVAHVPAKIVVLPNELLVLVSSAVSHHLRERVFAACADLCPTERVGSPLEVAAPA